MTRTGPSSTLSWVSLPDSHDTDAPTIMTTTPSNGSNICLFFPPQTDHCCILDFCSIPSVYLPLVYPLHYLFIYFSSCYVPRPPADDTQHCFCDARWGLPPASPFSCVTGPPFEISREIRFLQDNISIRVGIALLLRQAWKWRSSGIHWEHIIASIWRGVVYSFKTWTNFGIFWKLLLSFFFSGKGNHTWKILIETFGCRRLATRHNGYRRQSGGHHDLATWCFGAGQEPRVWGETKGIHLENAWHGRHGTGDGRWVRHRHTIYPLWAHIYISMLYATVIMQTKASRLPWGRLSVCMYKYSSQVTNSWLKSITGSKNRYRYGVLSSQ